MRGSVPMVSKLPVFDVVVIIFMLTDFTFFSCPIIYIIGHEILSKDNKLSHITKIKNIFKICKKSAYSIDMPAFTLSDNIYYWTGKIERSVKKQKLLQILSD
jgi:predicted hydrocarbon binding protein